MEGDLIAECRGWKLFALVPVLLLHKPSGTGSIGRDELAKRADDFVAGRWLELLQATSHTVPQCHTTLTEEQDELRRVQAAQARMRQGQVSRARHVLTGSALAPRTVRTFELLQGRRPGEVFQSAGIRLHTGKTSTWNRGGEVPQRMVELGPEVWSLAGDDKTCFDSQNHVAKTRSRALSQVR